MQKLIAFLKKQAQSKYRFLWASLLLASLAGLTAVVIGYAPGSPLKTPRVPVKPAQTVATASKPLDESHLFSLLKDVSNDKLSKLQVALGEEKHEVEATYRQGDVVKLTVHSHIAINRFLDRVMATFDPSKLELAIETTETIEKRKQDSAVLSAESLFAAWSQRISTTAQATKRFLGEHIFQILPSLIILPIMLLLVFQAMPDLLANRRAIQPSDIKGQMDDLIGMADIKREVGQVLDMFKNKSIYQEHGLDRPMNILLSGPAGTGKTKMAQYLAKDLGLPLFTVDASSLETGFVGGGSGTITRLYKRAARQKRAMIFLDEAQVLLMKRTGGKHSKFEDDTTNTFLALLDGVRTNKDAEVLWVVASNFDDVSMPMDDAVLRRFPVKINFRLPNKDEREGILKYYVSLKQAKHIGEIDYARIAEMTAGLSPALLETVANQASMLAIERKQLLDTQLLTQAFERVAIGLTDRKTTEGQEDKRNIVALHELGHFVVQLDQLCDKVASFDELNAKIPVLKISIESVSKMNALGFVLSQAEDAPLYTRADLEGQVTQLYGGLAAEEAYFGKELVTLGAHNDIEKATKLLQTMVDEMGMYSASKINLGKLNTEAAQAESLASIQRLSERLYENALAGIARNKALIDTVLPVLLEKYTLTKEEILALAEPFLVGRFGPVAEGSVPVKPTMATLADRD